MGAAGVLSATLQALLGLASWGQLVGPESPHPQLLPRAMTPWDLLCLAQLYQLLLLLQDAGEPSIALGQEMQDQLTAVIPKHAGSCTGETQGLQRARGKTGKWRAGAVAVGCLFITSTSSPGTNSLAFSETPPLLILGPRDLGEAEH